MEQNGQLKFIKKNRNFHTLVFFRETDACNSASSITMATWDSVKAGETTTNPEACTLSGLPYSWKTWSQCQCSETVLHFISYDCLPESLSSYCDTTATPAGLVVTPQLHWLWLYTRPFEWGLQCQIVVCPLWWLLWVCCAGIVFWEQEGCDWTLPPNSTLARPLRSVAGNLFCPPVQYLAWLSRFHEGPPRPSRSNVPRMDKAPMLLWLEMSSHRQRSGQDTEELKQHVNSLKYQVIIIIFFCVKYLFIEGKL